MSSYNAFFGQIEIDADNSGLIVDGASTTIDIDADSYYIYSPVSAESLLDVLCTAISAESTAAVTFSISESGVLTLSSASAFALEFDSTLYETLGFASAVLSSATSHVATYQLQMCWFPECLDSGHSAPVTSPGRRTPVFNQQQASDKSVWTTKYGEIVSQSLAYRYLSKGKTWEATTSNNSSWEEFFVSVYSQGRKFLFIPSWSDSETVYWYYVADLKAEASPAPMQSITGCDLYWDLTIYMLEVEA